MKYLILCFSLVVSQASFAKAVEPLTAKQAIEEIRDGFLGYQSLEGDYRGKPCEISLLSLEGFFGGLVVRITDSHGKHTQVSIENVNTQVARHRDREYETRYVVTGDALGTQSEIVIQGYEDISNFDLTLNPGNGEEAVCSFSE